MKVNLTKEKLIQLAVRGPVSRRFVVIKNDKIVGELFNQKRDLFFQNFLTSLTRLDNDEVDAIKYYIIGNDNVTILKKDENVYEVILGVEKELIKNNILNIIS